VGTKGYFDEVETKKYFVEPHIPGFAEFDKWKGKKVLEIGCGIGTDSINFARAGAELTCVELSETSLELCKRRFDVYNLKATFYKANVEELSKVVPVGDYDLIYSFGVLHHTPSPENAVKEIKKYMKKETEVRIMMYARMSYKTLYFYLKHGWKFNFSIKKTIKYFAEAQLNCPVAYTYTKKELVKLLEDFTVVDVYKDHIFQYDIKEYINYNYRKTFLFRNLPNTIIKFLESHLGWHTMVKFKSK
jgi:ubiquinone/menaquinone biosynthesis C-methylase UbiE